MADEKLLAILHQGADAWNKWRNAYFEVRIALRSARLHGMNLPSVDLARANLESADLAKANLVRANLSEAVLYQANLCGADLAFAKLDGADLVHANLSGANLSYADLSSARLCGANLEWADLRWAKLMWSDLAEANVGHACFRETRMFDVNLNCSEGLETITHSGPSNIDYWTLISFSIDRQLPLSFLRGCGLPDVLINSISSLHGPRQSFSCFISYSHEDKPFATRLHGELQEQGIRCWLDDHQILPGDDIRGKTHEGVTLWDKVLLCCSESALNSYWVNQEIEKALQKEGQLWNERQKRVDVIIPLDLDGYLFRWESSKASELTRRLAANFAGWETNNALFEAQLDRVVKALRADEGARERPPPPKL